MKVIVFGATGRTGQQFVKGALIEGFEVTAYIRNPQKMGISHENLTVVVGSLLDFNAVTEAMKGHDAVVSCLGGDGNKKSTTLTDIAGIIKKAMQKNDINRVIYLSTAGIHDEFPTITRFIVNLFLGNAIKDHKGAAGQFMADGLEYTLVRPMSLTDGPFTGQYREAITGIPKAGRNISRADVADYMIRALKDDTSFKQSVGLAY